MPLSEHEQRLLEQMEKALYAEDPKFATSLRSNSTAANRSRAALGVLGILGGLGVLLAGMAMPMAIVGVVGFVVMLAGAVLVYFAFTRGSAPVEAAQGEAEGDESPAGGSTRPPQGKQRRASSGFMDRMEERWRKRADGDS
ncbi:MAG TPA: DUF3040 domain-containing protein [Candidatus Nanopelagicales bacterium]|nr:DUF3040 domain-containing protein [Candidatus Nanopelagicales bacterium]